MFLEYIHVSLLMMRAKPVRAVLSLLGIYIGVLALVVILAIREGVRDQLEGAFRTRGAQIVYIQPGFDPVSKRFGKLTLDDVSRLAQRPEVLSTLPRVSMQTDLRSAKSSIRARIHGIDEEFVRLYRVPVLRGRAFLQEETERRRPVCLLTQEAVQKLFPMGNAIGSTVDMQGTVLQVIGIVDWTVEVSQRSSIPEVDALIPALWLAPRSQDPITMLEVRMQASVAPSYAAQLIKNTMSRGDKSRENLYFVRSMDDFMAKRQAMNDKILGGLLGIAGISLLVGGIGVANVMITSVTERTKEVGVRKALGATRVQILSQFLVESSMLSISGGVLAVLTGAVAVSVLPVLFGIKIPLVIPVVPSLGCLLVTVVVGLIAGVYPASRAAQLSPADALRYE